MNFIGQDSAGGANVYSQIVCTARDVTNGTEDGDLQFGTVGAGTYAVKMSIQGDGKVGIGTHEPDTALVVAYDASTDYLVKFQSKNTSTPYGLFVKYNLLV